MFFPQLMRQMGVSAMITAFAFGAAGSASATASSDQDPVSGQNSAQNAPSSDSLSGNVKDQLDYALTWWNKRNVNEYLNFYLPGQSDAANFVSQTLVARGWKMQGDPEKCGEQGERARTQCWYSLKADGVPPSTSYSFRYETELHNYIAHHPELGTQVQDSERDRVKLGDIVEFSWGGSAIDDSGTDFVGVVTRTERTAAGTKVYFASHKGNSGISEINVHDHDYFDVDAVLTDLNAKARYWSLS